MESIASQIERALVEIVDELAKAKGMKKVDFSARVWPETSPKAAYARWNVMRGKASKTGRPQGVLISDAQSMAEVLDEDLAYLLLRAKDRVRQKLEGEKAVESCVEENQKTRKPKTSRLQDD